MVLDWVTLRCAKHGLYQAEHNSVPCPRCPAPDVVPSGEATDDAPTKEA